MPIKDLASSAGSAALPSLAIGPAVRIAAEGSGGGTTLFVYTVTRTGDASRAVSVAWTVAGAGADPAGADDFVGGSLPAGVVALAAGETSAAISIGVVADDGVEPDESFIVTLSGATMSIPIDRPIAGGTILNDDAAPAIVPLPTVATAPQAAWGAMKLVANHAGPLFRLVRSSDAATLDIAAIAGGQAPEISGVAAWLGAAGATVDIVYDQTGGGRHLTQTTAANRPRFILAAAIRGRQPITMAGSGTGDTPRWLDVPAAITGSNRAFTRAAVFAAKCLQSGSLALYGSGFGAAGSLAFDTFSEGRLPGIYGGSSGFPGFPGLDYRAQPQVLIDSCGANAVTRYLDGASASQGAFASGDFAGGRVGSAGNGTSESDWFAEIIYPAALSASDAAALRVAFGAMADIPSSFAKQLVLAGNSITHGAFVSGLLNTVRQAEPAFAERIAIVNHGLDAYSAQAIYQNLSSFVAGLFKPALARNIFLAPEPSNDILGVDLSTAPDAAAYAQGLWSQWVLPFCTERRAQGTSVRVLVPTVLPRRWGGGGADSAKRDAIRAAYNAYALQQATAAGFTPVDFGAVTQMQNVDDVARYVDGTHPTTLGDGFLAPVLAAAVNENL